MSSSFSFPSKPVASTFFAEQGLMDVTKWEVVPVASFQKFKLVIERVTDLRPQGLWLCSDGGVEIEGKRQEQAVLIFHDAPHKIEFVCHSADGFLQLYNVWEDGKQRRSQMRMSGMKREPIKGGYRYHCTDTGPDFDFDRFVFSLTTDIAD